MENKMNSHRASADQWAATEKWAADCSYESCLIDLRNRLEALEAKQREAAMNELRTASAEARPATFDEDENDRRFEQAKAIIDRLAPAPAGSLVERVAIACAKPCNETWDDQAVAAICEVATYIRQHNPFFELDTPAESDVWGAVAELLDQEVNRD